MICLKNRTFAVSQTTLLDTGRKDGELWFAWKIVLLQYRKQRPYGSVRKRNRCDLLEKSYFCSIANNCTLFRIIAFRVVICLKNRTFAVSQTTYISRHDYCTCCDLLEKSYFCSIANNITVPLHVSNTVVICLKNRTFAVSQTTRMIYPLHDWVLWFAWKIVLLQYRKQLCLNSSRLILSCDLLEKSYFCSIANNTRGIPSSVISVVICLKNRTFAVSQTTVVQFHNVHELLWFAWKIVLLQYRKQLERNCFLFQLGCDLLEKSYFCSIANN